MGTCGCRRCCCRVLGHAKPLGCVIPDPLVRHTPCTALLELIRGGVSILSKGRKLKQNLRIGGEISMRMACIISLALSLTIIPTVIWGVEYSPADEAFKVANIGQLTPYGPGFNEEQRPIWQRMIIIAAKYEDYEIAKKMFEMHDHADGVMATQYSLDLFELYKHNPVFFVASVEHFYKGEFGKFLPIWINETFDVTAADLVKYAMGVSQNTSMERFLRTASEMHQQMINRQ